jgi:hypothetical protein
MAELLGNSGESWSDTPYRVVLHRSITVSGPKPVNIFTDVE